MISYTRIIFIAATLGALAVQGSGFEMSRAAEQPKNSAPPKFQTKTGVLEFALGFFSSNDAGDQISTLNFDITFLGLAFYHAGKTDQAIKILKEVQQEVQTWAYNRDDELVKIAEAFLVMRQFDLAEKSVPEIVSENKRAALLAEIGLARKKEFNEQAWRKRNVCQIRGEDLPFPDQKAEQILSLIEQGQYEKAQELGEQLDYMYGIPAKFFTNRRRMDKIYFKLLRREGYDPLDELGILATSYACNGGRNQEFYLELLEHARTLEDGVEIAAEQYPVIEIVKAYEVSGGHDRKVYLKELETVRDICSTWRQEGALLYVAYFYSQAGLKPGAEENALLRDIIEHHRLLIHDQNKCPATH